MYICTYSAKGYVTYMLAELRPDIKQQQQQQQHCLLLHCVSIVTFYVYINPPPLLHVLGIGFPPLSSSPFTYFISRN